MPVKAIPDGYYSLTPYLVCKGAAKAIEFYASAFGAQEVVRMPGPNGQIMHAEVKIGDSMLMLSDENPERGDLSPGSIGGTAALELCSRSVASDRAYTGTRPQAVEKSSRFHRSAIGR